jgi:hypothetical protein
MNDSDHNLIELYLEGNLPADKWEEFSRRLDQSADMRREFRKLSVLDENLRSQGLGLPNLAEREQNTTSPAFLPWLVAAASITLAFIFWSKEQQSLPLSKSSATEPAPLAQVTERTPILVGIDYQRGDTIWEPQAYELKEGAIELLFDKSVIFLFQGPGQFEILGPKLVQVKQGKLRTMVLNEQGHGFTIQTEESNFVDWGTEFSMNIQPNQKPQIRVEDGLVEIKSIDNQSLGFLTYKNCNRGVSNPDNFANSYQDFTNYRTAILEPNTLSSSRNLSQIKTYLTDESVLAYYGFGYPIEITKKDRDHIPDLWKDHSSSLAKKRFILNQKENSSFSHGIMHNCTRTAGKFSTLPAMSFNHSNSHVLFQADETFDQLSCNLWINIDRLSQAWSSIFGSRDWNTWGDFGVELPRTSRHPRFFAWGESSFESMILQSPQRFTDRWNMFTFTLKPGRSNYAVTVYLNGSQIYSLDSKYAKFVSSKYITLGANLSSSGNWKTSFTGKVDELVIWKRVLNSGEISFLYQQSAPHDAFLSSL